MKKVVEYLKIKQCLLKKYFFNWRKDDIYHECVNVLENEKENEKNEVEEYLKNYQSTTRWQTI